MNIIVTDHAVERYAARVIGIAPEDITQRHRDLIRAEISKVVEGTRMPGLMNWRAKLRNATYVIRNGAVTTVLLPWQRTNHGVAR